MEKVRRGKELIASGRGDFLLESEEKTEQARRREHI
jgi:hypothetical protein